MSEPSEKQQTRAQRKLGVGQSDPVEWKFTVRGLEQATPWQVGRLKASWFGDQPVFDLCCGIGGDAIPLNRRGKVIGYDQDPALVEMARANLCAAQSEHEYRVDCADVTQLALPANANLHIDPDRRIGEVRSTDVHKYQPDWTVVTQLMGNAAASVVKLAPVAKFDPSALPVHHRCWISLGRSVREQTIIAGTAVDRAGVDVGRKSAFVVRSEGSHHWYQPDGDSKVEPPEPCNRPLRYLIDPDPAIRAAGLTGAFAMDHGCRLLHRESGFLTSDRQPPEPLAIVGEVEWVGACDDRRLRKEMRTRNVYPETIKVRGTDHDPVQLTRRYRDCGQRPVRLWIGRLQRRRFAAITN